MIWILSSFCNISCFCKRYCLFSLYWSLQWACNIFSLLSPSTAVFAILHACSCEQILPSVTRLLRLESHLEGPLLQTQHHIKLCYIRYTIHSLWHSERGEALNVPTKCANMMSVKIQTKEYTLKTGTNWSSVGVCGDWKCPGDYGLPFLRDKVYYMPVAAARAFTCSLLLIS